jgi:endoglucanase
MQPGWNLGNSFDSVDTNLSSEDKGELSWGNVAVTKEQIQFVKDEGYNSIRIPLTLYKRVSGKGNDDTTTADDYIIDSKFLDRYTQVVKWALDSGLYVMVNVHHDSWIWLNSWDGSKDSEQYIMYTRIWEQLADKFKDYSDKLCFETINEPKFDTDAPAKLRVINKAAYDIIRKSGGANSSRMIVVPTLSTNDAQDKCDALYEQIKTDFKRNGIQDENIIATFHYYSEWVFSANLGKTGFDEVLWNSKDANGVEYGYTPRIALDQAFGRVYNTFTKNGIGVICGEYGLLGNDNTAQCNNKGEDYKYMEYINYVARQKGITLMLWDNGKYVRMIDREKLAWRDESFRALVKACNKGRSSYATGLDSIYLTKDKTEEIAIPLTLNGNTLKAIKDEKGTLLEGTDYKYDAKTATVTLASNYIKQRLNASDFGLCAMLTMQFSSGTDWLQYIYKSKTPEFGDCLKSVNKAIIDVNYNGNELQKVTAYQSSGKVGPNSSWWNYLQFGSAFLPDYKNGTLKITSNFFGDSSVKEGKILLECTFYNGEVVYYVLNRKGNVITGSKEASTILDSIVKPSIPENVTLYAGEKDLSAYINAVKGYGVTGSWASGNACYVDYGNNNAIIFSDKAVEGSTQLGFNLNQYSNSTYLFTNVSIVNAPSIDRMELKVAEKKVAIINNTSKDAVVKYKIGNRTIAKVDKSGTVKGVKAGTTTLTVTVTQYGRTDSFKTLVKVK